MRALLSLCLYLAAVVGPARAQCGASIHGQCYKRHRLPISGSLKDVDRNTNTLYITEKGVVKQCTLSNVVCHPLNVPNAWRAVVDQSTGYIYYSGPRHIFKLNPCNNVKENLFRDKLYDLAFKDKLYYSPWYSYGIATLENGEKRMLDGTMEYDIYSFIIDRYNDIYFEDQTTENHVIRRLRNGVVNRNEVWDASYFMSVDNDGNAMFVDKESHVIYKVANGTFTDIGVIHDSVISAPLFDKDNNIIYKNNADEFYHLKRDTDCETVSS